jgi:adenylate kinase family enzyme
MQRITVIGSGGAGKSTFSRRLAVQTGLPLVHLDSLYWKPGWIEPSREQWLATVDGIIARPRWILDGNYGGSLDRRLAASDTVIFMDTPVLTCLWRVIRRRLQHRGRARAEMPAGCNERLDPGFILWILGYPIRQRPAIRRRLETLRLDKQVVILRSVDQVEHFLGALPKSSPTQD